MQFHSLLTHPTGESRSIQKRPINLDTYAGKLNIEWEADAKMTRQLSFFIACLTLGVVLVLIWILCTVGKI